MRKRNSFTNETNKNKKGGKKEFNKESNKERKTLSHRFRKKKKERKKEMLYILTSVWVLHTPNAGRNSHFPVFC